MLRRKLNEATRAGAPAAQMNEKLGKDLEAAQSERRQLEATVTTLKAEVRGMGCEVSRCNVATDVTTDSAAAS